MKIVQVNTFPNKATGSIMMNIHRLLIANGHKSYVVWGRGRKSTEEQEISIKNTIEIYFHIAFTRITGRTGFSSKHSTKKLLKCLDIIKPDILHLHNIHGYYLNMEMLFNYIFEHKMHVVWTIHDCWPITGHCAYFDMAGCEKWKTGCFHCKQKLTYPKSYLIDSSKWNWYKKRELFTCLNIDIVTPSQWLKNIFEQSFMERYPIHVIHNGINLNVYRPSYNIEMKKKYCTHNEFLVLCVASEWTERKGLLDIITLSKITDELKFVIVGLTRKQCNSLPQNIIGIERTNNPQELAVLYSIADVFFNPTYEDNFPTTNLESLACGTPVVTYDTGGSPESLQLASGRAKRTVGIVIKKESPTKVDVKKVYIAIKELASAVKSNDLPSPKTNQIRKACMEGASLFDAANCLKPYLKLYEEIYSKQKK